MKSAKILFAAVIGLFSLYSCSLDDNNEDSLPEVDLNATAFRADVYVNPSTLPQPILTYISTNYPNERITEAELEDDNSYEVILSNGQELVFDAQGNFLGIDGQGGDDFGDQHIAPANLSDNIKIFILSYFPGTAVVRAEREWNGNVEVELSNGVGLIFGANGIFLGIAEDEVENEDINDEDIPISQLPQAVRDYISQNYPNNSIIEAEREDDGFEVTLNNGVELRFDEEGNFISAEDRNGDDEDEDEND